MKLEKYLSAIFAVLAVALIVVTAVGYAYFHQTPPMIQVPQEDAEVRTELLMEALCQSDYAAAGESLYGSPELQWNPDAASELGALLWKAYSNSMSYEFSGPCYVTGTGIFRDVTVTVLDIPALCLKIGERFQALMEPYLAEAQYDSEAFDENGVLRQDFSAGKLRKATEQVLLLRNSYATHQITLEPVYQNGQWWVMPKQNLIDIVAGVMTP